MNNSKGQRKIKRNGDNIGIEGAIFNRESRKGLFEEAAFERVNSGKDLKRIQAWKTKNSKVLG